MRLLILSLFLITFAGNAEARKCYKPNEAEAEQGIRIHSELMVIGLNCQHMTPAGWKNFYQQYREITSRNQGLIKEYESTLLSHYGGGAKKIHTLRTGFANQISTSAARMRPDVFCANYASRIPQVAQMSSAEIRQWAASASTTQKQSKPICN
ncbi:MAG: hypothetical protein AAF549_05795 [Pseudomonadota bacterium]